MKQMLLKLSILPLSINSAFAFQGTNPVPTPTGYTLIDSSKASIRLYKKGSSDSYVQLIDLAGGATVRINNPGVSYAPPQDPTFTNYSLDTHWNYAQGYQNLYSMVNGQFFNYSLNPLVATKLAFGVRTNSSVLANGYDNCCQRRILKINNGNAAAEAQTASMSTYSVPTAIVGLAPSEDRSSNSSIGRLFMCAAGSSNAQKPWLIVLSAKSMYQADAILEIRKFGCADSDMVMMDGSGSSQLKTITGITMYGDGIPTGRSLPQVVVFTY